MQRLPSAAPAFRTVDLRHIAVIHADTIAFARVHSDLPRLDFCNRPEADIPSRASLCHLWSCI